MLHRGAEPATHFNRFLRDGERSVWLYYFRCIQAAYAPPFGVLITTTSGQIHHSASLEANIQVVRLLGFRCTGANKPETFVSVRILFEKADHRIDTAFKSSENCRRIAGNCNIGPKPTAVVAALGGGRKFTNGRHPAAWLGRDCDVIRAATRGLRTRFNSWGSANGDIHPKAAAPQTGGGF